jgi:hypothetical protein
MRVEAASIEMDSFLFLSSLCLCLHMQVHGAMSSGQRAARQIQQRLEQQLTRAFPDRLPAPAAALGTKHKKPPRRRLKRNRVPDSEDEAEAKQTEIGVG